MAGWRGWALVRGTGKDLDSRFYTASPQEMSQKAGEYARRRELPRRLFGGFFLGLLLGASATEDVPHGLVSLVTGVLEDFHTVVLRPGHRKRPRFGERGRIIDRDFPVNFVRSDPREALNQMQILVDSLRHRPRCALGATSCVDVLVVEIGRVDHQRVSLPAAPRVPQPLAD